MDNPTGPTVDQPNLLHMASSSNIVVSTGDVAGAAPGVRTPWEHLAP